MTTSDTAISPQITVPDIRPRQYDAYVGGRDVPGVGWVHTLHANAVIHDPVAALSLQAELDGAALTEPMPEHPWVIGRTTLVDIGTVDQALRAAAQAAPTWAETDLDTRLGVLRAFAASLDDHAEEFLQLLAAEGHPVRTGRWELEGMRANASEQALAELRDQLWREVDDDTGRQILRRRPDGVVVLCPPANAPGPIAAIAAMAIAVGNTTVVRVPRTGPLAVMWLLRDVLAPIVENHGAPAGTLNVVCADPGEAQERMITADEVDTVLYFGSTARGKKVQKTCAEHAKKSVLELAGNDTLVVGPGADLDGAAHAASEAFAASGQICMLPNRIVAYPELADELLERLLTQASRCTPGYPDDPDTVLAVLRNQGAYFHALQECRDAAGVEVLCGGGKLDAAGMPDDDGLFVEPALVRVDGLAAARALQVVTDETFCPVLPVIVPREHELDEVIAFVNDNRFGLRNSLWTTDQGLIDTWMRRVRNGGRVGINAPHTTVQTPLLPTNGGTGASSGGNAFGAQNFGLELTHVQGWHLPHPGLSWTTPLGLSPS